MTELTPSDIIKFSQKALILNNQLKELLKLANTFQSKYPHSMLQTEFIRSYNKILESAKKLFALDSEFSDAISHLVTGDLPFEGTHLWAEVQKIIPQLRVLKGTLDAFFEWLKLLEEKKDT